MKTLHFALALTSSFASLAYAEPSMTIYGTFKETPDETDNEQPRKTPFNTPYQSTVNIYGTIDAGIRNVTNTTKTGGGTLKMGSNGEYYNNRIGIKGREDLGGGMDVHYHFETGFNTGTGALDNKDNRFFNRISSLGLAGPFGSIDFGRQPSVACKVVYLYEPFQYRYVQIIPLAGAVAGNMDSNVTRPFGTVDGPRFSNGIQYFGKFGGFTASAEYVMGEVAGSSNNAAAKAMGLAYTTGVFTVAGAYTQQKPNIASSNTPDYRDQDQVTFGAAYKDGALRIAGGYLETTTKAAVTNHARNTWLGANYDLTPIISLTAGYYRTTLEAASNEIARRNLLIIGATYALSKHTNIYTGFDKASLRGIASLTANKKTLQTGISIGINHMF